MSHPQTDHQIAFECAGLRKEFPGVVALDDVSLNIPAGQIHALVGENGAGKSTLVKIIAGQLEPEQGRVQLFGRRFTRFTPREAARRGVTMVPQHPELFHSLSALENLFVGEWPLSSVGTVSWSAMKQRADDALDQMNVDFDLEAPISALAVADRQLVQIARALLADARLLILDEPTAPLGHDDTQRLFNLLRRLNDRGVTIIYISHRLEEIFEIAKQVTVLRDGALVDSLPVEQATRDHLVRMMVGKTRRAGTKSAQIEDTVERPRQTEQTHPDPDAEPVLQVHGLASEGKFDDVTFDVRPGEVVGIAGVAGSGRNQVMRAVAGVEPPEHGSIVVDGGAAKKSGPRAMRDAGVSFVPADRHNEALILPMSLRENISLSSLRKFAGRLGLIRTSEEQQRTAQMAKQLDVRASSIEQQVNSLSGGNQQKAALASRLLTRPRVLLLEEPTQGVDVGARAEIHRLLASLKQQGVGIVLVSSDLDELLSLSDRLLVMHRGRIVGEFEHKDATKGQVLDLALGTAEQGVAQSATAVRRMPMRELVLAAVLILLVGAISLRAPNFASAGNLMDILVNNTHLLIAAVGMTVVIVAAGIDISVGSMLAVCATVAGAVAAAGASPFLVLCAGIAAGSVLGAINAGLITRAQVPAIIATLATLTLFRHALIHVTGGRWIDLPPAYREFGMSKPLGVPIPVWVAAIVALLGIFLTRWTAFGRSLYAVGSNPTAAEHQGIPVRTIRTRAYLTIGLLMGLAAFAYSCRFSAIQTNTGLGFEMVVITAVLVGGTDIFGGSGSVLGTVIGVLLLGVITGSLTHLHIDSTWEKAFQGILILAAVVVDTLHSHKRRET